MKKITKHTPGMFSWTDLGTTDPDAAKTFYSELFGWRFEDMPMGDAGFYSMARLEGEDAAAVFPQPEEERSQGVPPHWTCYFTVDDVDASAKKVSENGGTVLAAPFDVYDFGRMCVFAEPAGGVAALWQPNAHIGTTIQGHHGAITWAELLSRDVHASVAFFQKLFGFETAPMPMPDGGKYYVCKVGEQPSCGIMEMPSVLPKEVPSHWAPYFMVDDCDATIEKAKSLGGKLAAPVVSMPGVGRFTRLTDPQGVVFEILQPEM